MTALFLLYISSPDNSHLIVRCSYLACGSHKENSLKRTWTPAHAGAVDAVGAVAGSTETTTDETDHRVDRTEMGICMETLMDTHLTPRRTHTSRGIRTPRLRADLVALARMAGHLPKAMEEAVDTRVIEVGLLGVVPLGAVLLTEVSPEVGVHKGVDRRDTVGDMARMVTNHRHMDEVVTLVAEVGVVAIMGAGMVINQTMVAMAHNIMDLRTGVTTVGAGMATLILGAEVAVAGS